MIEEHAINTAWYGDRIGIVTDPAFFSLDPAAQTASMAEFAWVEYKSPLASAPPALHLLSSGFSAVDVQIEFRIGLKRIAATSSLEPLTVRFADETPFSVHPEDVTPFKHERFRHIPGMTPAKLTERDANWAQQWIAKSPDWCLQVLQGTKPQGWFLSKQTDRGLNLTLAMLHRDATISGMHLYHKSLIAYADRGARTGWASFSVSNTPVLNIFGQPWRTVLTGDWVLVVGAALMLVHGALRVKT